MKVICKGYKNCDFRNMCPHSEPHELVVGSNIMLTDMLCQTRGVSDCICSGENLLSVQRKNKLKKINKQ